MAGVAEVSAEPVAGTELRAAGGVGQELPDSPHRSLVRDQRGMVSAEFAVVLMAVSLVIIMVVFAATVGVSYVQTQDAARQAARLVARGEPHSVAKQQARRAIPDAKISISESGEAVSVSVVSAVSLPIAKLRLPALTVSSTAHTPRERHGN